MYYMFYITCMRQNISIIALIFLSKKKKKVTTEYIYCIFIYCITTKISFDRLPFFFKCLATNFYSITGTQYCRSKYKPLLYCLRRALKNHIERRCLLL